MQAAGDVRRRRALFVAIAGAIVVAGTWATLRSGAAQPVADQAGAPVTSSSPAATSNGDPAAREMPPAWLAWITGSLPPGIRARAAAEPALGTTVVVAGDTRWLRVSHDDEGRVVDRPTPPFTIPIDAFAVSPNAYAPFVPPTFRDAVVGALADGRAVLGRSSARLRHLSAGGSLTFDGGTVEIGAVVPDPVAGWSELLVSRATGRELGIVDQRYLLSLPAGQMREQRFASILARLIPGTPIRTVPPGGSDYMRIASGVDPPVVMKGVFGEFAAYPQPADPAYLTVSPGWYDANIQTRRVPLLGTVTCNRALFPMLIRALREVEAAGLGGEIHTYSGCYAARTIARRPTAPPSNHAYGAAIDINAPENPYGVAPTLDPRVVRIFERWGFLWGGDFLTPDGMHFEYGSPARPMS